MPIIHGCSILQLAVAARRILRVNLHTISMPFSRHSEVVLIYRLSFITPALTMADGAAACRDTPR